MSRVGRPRKEKIIIEKPTLYCAVCNKVLTGKQMKLCSKSCEVEQIKRQRIERKLKQQYRTCNRCDKEFAPKNAYGTLCARCLSEQRKYPYAQDRPFDSGTCLMIALYLYQGKNLTQIADKLGRNEAHMISVYKSKGKEYRNIKKWLKHYIEQDITRAKIIKRKLMAEVENG